MADKNQKKNKKMTLDGLAVLMKQGFSRVDRKLDANQESMAVMVKNAVQGTQDLIIKRMDERFDAVDKKFDEIGEKFEDVNYKLDKIDKKLESQEKIIFGHNQKIDRIEVELKLKKA